MLFQTVMFFWAVITLLLGVGCTVALLSRKAPAGDTETLPKSLFDFSAGQVEGRQMEQVLTDALAKSTTDAEFEHSFKSNAQAINGMDAELTWAWLGRSLLEYRHAGDFEPSARMLAERFLADIPRRYKFQAQPIESSTI